MTRYLARRLLQSVVIIWGVSVVVFGITRLSGSPVDLLLPLDAPEETRQRLIERMGLDQPFWVQYLRFAQGAVTGEFGESFRFKQPALALVVDRIPATLELTAFSLILATAVGVPLGVLAAVRRGRVVDLAITGLISAGQAVPSFWLGIMLMLYFGLYLGLLPTSGRGTPAHLVLPGVTLAVVPLVTIARLTRSSMLQVLPQAFIRTARAKGLREQAVLYRHALRNALIPVITIVGLQLGGLLSGAVITEQIFNWPGIGRLAIETIFARDYPVVQAVTLVTSVAVVFLNLLVDLSYVWIDPRIRYEG